MDEIKEKNSYVVKNVVIGSGTNGYGNDDLSQSKTFAQINESLSKNVN